MTQPSQLHFPDSKPDSSEYNIYRTVFPFCCFSSIALFTHSLSSRFFLSHRFPLLLLLFYCSVYPLTVQQAGKWNQLSCPVRSLFLSFFCVLLFVIHAKKIPGDLVSGGVVHFVLCSVFLYI